MIIEASGPRTPPSTEFFPFSWFLCPLLPSLTCTSLSFYSPWRRWQTGSGSTRSWTMRFLPSWISTWSPWRRTVPPWSMCAASNHPSTSPWPPPARRKVLQTLNLEEKQERESHNQPATGSDWTVCGMDLEGNKNLPKHICTSWGLGLCMLSHNISMVVSP